MRVVKERWLDGQALLLASTRRPAWRRWQRWLSAG